MSKNQTVHEHMPRKATIVQLPRRLSEKRRMSSESKRRLLSRSSAFGSRVFFHRRGDKLKTPRYQNTYRLESFRRFHPETVDKIVVSVMESKLASVTSYEPDKSAKLCLEIAQDVKKAVCKKDYDRYKIVTQVTIVQHLQQSVHSSFQCLWDVDRDNYSYHVFENNHIYAWCLVFGMYYE